MTVERSHGKRRPRVPRPGETPADVRAAVLAAPLHDPATGRWLPRNQAARLRALKSLADIAALSVETCAPWARPFVELARDEASKLVVEAGAEASPSLIGFAEDAATALAMHRAFLAVAVAPDVDPKTKTTALAEARAWMREHRQSLLSLRAEARAGVPGREGGDLAALEARLNRRSGR